MIGKGIAAAIARRGFLGGALGLGAAAGLGVKPSGAAQIGLGGMTLPASELPGTPHSGPGNLLREEPSWLKGLYGEARERQRVENDRVRFDNLDLDLAMLRSPSPAYKLVMQARRNRARELATMTLWERVNEAREKWMRGLSL